MEQTAIRLEHVVVLFLQTATNGMDEWCRMNCHLGNCPPTHCECEPEETSNEELPDETTVPGPELGSRETTVVPDDTPSDSEEPSSASEVSDPKSGSENCRAAGAYAGSVLAYVDNVHLPNNGHICSQCTRRTFPKTQIQKAE